ncbi:MAG: winged helix-turn-helix transcriptional regulator [Gammaproteobacteria bacterium]|nr:winged helix-turn-helix transcriptional regulator [Gammaproteobacteria bacterium]
MKDSRECSAAVADVSGHTAEAARFLKALANEQRLQVLCALLWGPRSVGDINAELPLSQSALSQHLGVLREAGVVRTERRSQTVYYSLAPGPALDIMGVLHRTYCATATPPRALTAPRRGPRSPASAPRAASSRSDIPSRRARGSPAPARDRRRAARAGARRS